MAVSYLRRAMAEPLLGNEGGAEQPAARAGGPMAAPAAPQGALPDLDGLIKRLDEALAQDGQLL